PVKIVELARHLIRLSGLEPDRDIAIVFTGARPGEKLFEDLLTAEEGTSATCHERVFRARMTNSLTGLALETCLAQLEQGALNNSRADMMAALQTLVPTNQLKCLAPGPAKNGGPREGAPQALPPSGARPGAVPRTNPALPESS
ncbi:MAG TPA: polysaccharide biosynthesis protein, partial [Dehalococcoidia bacterium]|nr:polysaccharide biosynthesis protein [Dehalococcoidia bacterium]